jgi:hypothetical protein
MSEFVASAPRSEPAAKSKRPPNVTLFRPRRSPNVPPSSMNAANVKP